MRTLTERVAVCSWSLQPHKPHDLITKLQATGIRRVQLALDPLRESPGVWGETPALLRQSGIAIVLGHVRLCGRGLLNARDDPGHGRNCTRRDVGAKPGEHPGYRRLAAAVRAETGYHSTRASCRMRRKTRASQDAATPGRDGGCVPGRGYYAGFWRPGRRRRRCWSSSCKSSTRPNVGVNFDPPT